MIDPQPEPVDPGQAFLRHLRRKLGAGLLVVVPVGITLFVFRFFFNLFDGVLAPYIKRLKVHFSGSDAYIPGFGIVIGVLVIYLAGLLTTNVLGRRMLIAWEDILSRIPLVKSLYRSAKQIMEVFAKPGRSAFRRAVYVDFPLEGTYALAYVTNDIVTDSGKRYSTCFVPTSPNPTSGFVLVLESDLVYPAGISVEEAMRIIVSGGMISPEIVPLRSEGNGKEPHGQTV